MFLWLRLFVVMATCALALLGCAKGISGDEFDDGNGASSSGGGGGTGGGTAGSAAGGVGGASCAEDTTAPTVTSSTDPLSFDPGTGTVSYELTFSEEVTLDAGAIVVSAGATVSVTPALPATGATFTVQVSGMDDDGSYALTIVAAEVTDRCDHQLAADVVIDIEGPCIGDTDPPQVTSSTDPIFLTAGTTSHQYQLTFDEPATIQTGGITVSGGATITGVSPALPATSNSFMITVGNLTAGHDLTISAVAVSDECGNDAQDDVVITICSGSGGTITFDYTGTIVTWDAPQCAAGDFIIEVYGAQGGSNTSSNYSGGLGAYIKGDFALAPGTQLKVLVGEFPGTDTNGGGGGSFVTLADDTPLIIAGGGGGSSYTTDAATKHGAVGTAGQPGAGGGGLGGTSGGGGFAGATSWNAGAGGGLLGNGADGSSEGGYAFVNGGLPGTLNARGGFGGGGSGSGWYVGGGGGGYSGGGGGGNSSAGVGGGGGSFNSGVNPYSQAGANAGHGRVVISWP